MNRGILLLMAGSLIGAACGGPVPPTALSPHIESPTLPVTAAAATAVTVQPTTSATAAPTASETAQPELGATITPLAPGAGHVWHVSVSGDDAHDGSARAPFRSIQHCADVAQAGDTCSIHSGVYRETVAITHSGSAGAPIQFEAFGRDEVTVSGADEVGNWSLAAGSIYQTSVGWSLGQGRDQVFVDGVALVEARTPNTPEPRWAYPIDGLSSLWPARVTTDANPTKGQDADRYHIVSPEWEGLPRNALVGGLYVGWHYWGWTAQTGVIDASEPGGLTVDPASVSSAWWCYHALCVADWYPDNGRGYVSGLAALLDSPGEFYLDPDAQRLQLWLPGNADPAVHRIEVKHRQLAFDLRGQSYIQLVGLKVFAASLTMDGGSYNVIDHCRFEYVSHFTLVDNGRDGWIDPPSSPTGGSTFLSRGLGGLYIGGHDNAVTNSVIRYSAGAGLVLQGYRHLVHNNLIQECDYSGTYLANIFITYDPLVKTDSKREYYRGGHHITYNTLRESGRFLLSINSLGDGDTLDMATHYESLIIEYNEIFNASLLTKDTGAVYAYGNTLGSEAVPGQFAYNVVHDSWNTEVGGPGLVYWDNGTWFVQNDHNVVWGAPGSLQKDHHFNTGGEGRIWDASNVWLPDHVGGVAALTDQDFPAGQRFSFGYNLDRPVVGVSIPTPTPTPLNPDIFLQAEAASLTQGVKVESSYVSQCDVGDWIAFDNLYLAGSYDRLRVRILVPSANPGQHLEVRLDSPEGVQVGDLVTVASNEDLTFVTLTAQLHGAGGNHTVYLVCAGQGRVGTLDWIRFEGGAGPTATPAPMAVNLAYGHRVEASSVALDGAGSCCQTDFATDGDSDTRWGSQYTDPQWIMVDLGQVETIDRIVLKWEVAFGKDYTIEVADASDGPWRVIGQVSDGDGGTDEVKDLGAHGRFVRVNGTQRGTPYGYSLWEFEVYGPTRP